MRKRIAAIVGIAMFAVLAGTGIGYAYWSSTAAATGTVKTASLVNTCVNPAKIVNGGMETPNISPDTLRTIGINALTGWTIVNDNVVEVWRGYNDAAMPVHPLPAAEGSQFVELNGNGAGTLYQDVATTPGQILHWSVKHHGRWGTDTMRVSINAAGGALVQQAQFSTSNADWKMYQGDYVVPAGQTSTRISLTAVSTATGDNTVGNLVDDVTFGSGPCLTSTAAITNITTGGTTYKVGDVVEYTTTLANSGGNHANSSVFTATVPTGLAYVAGSVTIDGVAKTDASGDDTATATGGTITARLGQGASASAGGAIPPGNSTVVKFRATVQSAAAGGSLVYNSSTAYVDALAPLWPLAAASPTLTTAVDAAADLSVVVQSAPAPVLGSASAGTQVTWVMRVTNNGPGAATGAAVAMTFPIGNTSAGLTGRTLTYGVSNTSCGSIAANATTALTCNVGTLASGSSVDITFRGTMPGSPSGSRTVTATASAAQYDPTTPNFATSTVTYDGTAPTTPANLTATRSSNTQINLSWTASTDASGIAGYRIYRNGVLVNDDALWTTTSFPDAGRAPNQPYWYWIVAVDNAGNASGQSTGAGAVTYSDNTSLRVKWLPNGTANQCLVAESNADNQPIRTQNCDSATAGLRQWQLINPSGNNAYVRFNSGGLRFWRAANNTSPTPVTTGTTATETQWIIGARWSSGQAYVEIRRATATTLCLNVAGTGTGINLAAQQLTCDNDSVRQRFALLVP